VAYYQQRKKLGKEEGKNKQGMKERGKERGDGGRWV